MKWRYDRGVEGISDIMYCVTGKMGGGLAILPLIIEYESKTMPDSGSDEEKTERTEIQG